jgi:hypothetical protein
MALVTFETAREIWLAYDEIAKAEKLIAEMHEQMARYDCPNPRDLFGHRRCLQLGVPSGDNSHRLFDVQPELAITCIKAHIAGKRAVLEAASERARAELSGAPAS